MPNGKDSNADTMKTDTLAPWVGCFLANSSVNISNFLFLDQSAL